MCIRDRYKKVLEFLEVEDDGKSNFPKINQAKKNRFHWVAKFTQKPPRAIVSGYRFIRKVLNFKGLGVLKEVQKLNMIQPKLEKPNSSTLEEMEAVFYSDIELLNRKLEGRVSDWL